MAWRGVAWSGVSAWHDTARQLLYGRLGAQLLVVGGGRHAANNRVEAGNTWLLRTLVVLWGAQRAAWACTKGRLSRSLCWRQLMRRRQPLNH